MKKTVNVFERGPKGAKKIASFDVEARTTDGLGKEVRSKLKRTIISMSHGPRAITVYVSVRT